MNTILQRGLGPWHTRSLGHGRLWSSSFLCVVAQDPEELEDTEAAHSHNIRIPQSCPEGHHRSRLSRSVTPPCPPACARHLHTQTAEPVCVAWSFEKEFTFRPLTENLVRALQ